MCQKDKFGSFDDPIFVAEITSLISLKKSLFNEEHEEGLTEIAMSILRSIENKIEFHKVKHITN